MSYTSYSGRNAFLATLGYESYADYLASDRWKFIRLRILEGGRQCFICSREATSIHHERYTSANLTGTSNEWLRPICASCHKQIEVGVDGSKVFDIEEVNNRARLLKFRLHRHTGIHGPPLKPPPPGPNTWQARMNLEAIKLRNKQRLEEAMAKRNAELLKMSAQKSLRTKLELKIDKVKTKKAAERLGIEWPLAKGWRKRWLDKHAPRPLYAKSS